MGLNNKGVISLDIGNFGLGLLKTIVSGSSGSMDQGMVIAIKIVLLRTHFIISVEKDIMFLMNTVLKKLNFNFSRTEKPRAI